MINLNDKNPSEYREDAMTGSVCLVCGELIGKHGYIYRGKTVCSNCIEFIRSSC